MVLICVNHVLSMKVSNKICHLTLILVFIAKLSENASSGKNAKKFMFKGRNMTCNFSGISITKQSKCEIQRYEKQRSLMSFFYDIYFSKAITELKVNVSLKSIKDVDRPHEIFNNVFDICLNGKFGNGLHWMMPFLEIFFRKDYISACNYTGHQSLLMNPTQLPDNLKFLRGPYEVFVQFFNEKDMNVLTTLVTFVCQ